MTRRVAMLCLILGSALCAVGAARGQGRGGLYDPDAVVAMVNGEVVTVRKLGDDLVSELGLTAIDDMIRRRLVEQAAKRQGVTVSAEDLAARRELESRLRLYQAATSTRLTLGELEGVLKRQGKDLETERKAIAAAVPETALRVQALAERICGAKLEVTEEDIRRRWAETRGPRFLAAHIVVRNEKQAEQIVLLLSQKLAGEVNLTFDRMVQEASLDRDSAPWGGRMQPLTPESAFGQVLQKMKPGELKVVSSGAGWHVLKLLKRCPQYGPDLEQVREEVAKEALVLKASGTIDAWMQELVRKAAIFYNLRGDEKERSVLGAGVAAYVNTQPIARRELADALLEQFGKGALDEYINAELVFQYAKGHGLDVTPAEMDERTAEMVDKKIAELARERGLSREEMERGLTQMGIDLKRYRETVETLFVSRRRVRAYLLARKLADKVVAVTEEDIRQEYEAEHGPRIWALDLAVTDPDRAEQLRREAMAGADFKQLVRENGLGVGAWKEGGRVGPIGPRDAYWAIVGEMKVNAISDVFRAEDGFLHVLKVVERRRPDDAKGFSEVREEMAGAVRERKMNVWMHTWLEELRAKATVKKLMFM
jgi:parvulin-like peptidyl-prolyl isomerase